MTIIPSIEPVVATRMPTDVLSSSAVSVSERLVSTAALWTLKPLVFPVAVTPSSDRPSTAELTWMPLAKPWTVSPSIEAALAVTVMPLPLPGVPLWTTVPASPDRVIALSRVRVSV